MPIHPFFGARLSVLGALRWGTGQRYVVVELPSGQRVRLPEEWTDRCVPATPPRVDGQELRVSGRALLDLADLLTKLMSSIDVATDPEVQSAKQAEDRDADRRDAPASSLGNPESGGVCGAAADVGEPGSPDDARRGLGAGGAR